MKVTVGGGRDLYRLAHALKQAGPPAAKLKRELDKASRKAGEEIEREVKAHTRDYIPQGFERRFDLSLDTKTEVRLVQSRRITVVFSAMGKRGQRHIRRINEGELRHPVYGRTRRLKAGGKYVRKGNEGRIVGDRYTNPWVGQRIRPGLVDEPARRAMPKAVKHIEDAVDRVVTDIERIG